MARAIGIIICAFVKFWREAKNSCEVCLQPKKDKPNNKSL